MTVLSRFLLAFRKPIVALWVLSTLIILGYLVVVPHEIERIPLLGALDTDAHIVEQLMKKEFGVTPAHSAGVVIQGKDPGQDFINTLQNAFPKINQVEKIEGQTKHNHTLYYLSFDPKTSVPTLVNSVPQMQDFLSKEAQKYKIKIHLTGHLGFIYDTNHAAHKEAGKNEKLALSLAFIILILNFGSLLSSLLPILMGGTTLILLSFLSRTLELPMTPASLIMNSMVGLALAIDYSLFMVSRFNEESTKGKTAAEALKTTLSHAGETILFSALIMLLSISVLLIPDLSITRAVVIGLSVVICLSIFVSLIILPAILLVSQKWLEWPRWLSKRITAFDSYQFWKRFSTHVVTYPKTYFFSSLLAILLLAYPALNMKLWAPIHSLAPPESASYKGYQALKDDNWGGELIPIQVIVQEPNGQTLLNQKHFEAIERFTQFAKSQTLVSEAFSITNISQKATLAETLNFYRSTTALSAAGLFNQELPFRKLLPEQEHTTLIHVIPHKDMNIHNTYKVIANLRAFAEKEPSLKIYVGGIVARSQDFILEIYQYLPMMVTCIILGIFLILFYYMDAIVLPLKAALMNFLPIFGAYGFVTLIFQYGYGSSIFNTPHNGGITGMVPVILFCVVFGLSMDYEVLIISRISEFYAQDQDVKGAVIEGLARSGSVITGAALILLGVFMPGVLSNSPLVKEIALGISMAIFIDATLLRLFLVPTFILLMGKYNWWNPFSKKT